MADKPNEEFAKPDAPKRKIDVPADPDENAVPVHEKPAQDDQPPMEDIDASGYTPAPAPIQRVPAPTPAPATAPMTEAMPDDSADGTKNASGDKPKGPGKVKKLFHLFGKKKKDATDTPQN